MGKIWIYFTLAFAISWLIWLPGVLATQGVFTLPVPPMVWVVAGAHGPLVASVALTHRSEGWAGVRRFIRSGFQVSMGGRWYSVIFFLPVILAGIALWINVAAGGYRPDLNLLEQPWLILPTFVLAFFLFGSVQEEFGWRGYALPHMLDRWNALTASAILGLLWGFWHLPLFFIGGSSQSYMPFGIFIALAAAFSIVFTWIYMNTRGNLFSALLLHTTINLSFNVFPPFEQRIGGDQRAFVLLLVLYAIVALFIINSEREKWLREPKAG